MLPDCDSGSTCASEVGSAKAVVEGTVYRITRDGEGSKIPGILGYGQLRVLTLLHAGLPFLRRI